MQSTRSGGSEGIDCINTCILTTKAQTLDPSTHSPPPHHNVRLPQEPLGQKTVAQMHISTNTWTKMTTWFKRTSTKRSLAPNHLHPTMHGSFAAKG